MLTKSLLTLVLTALILCACTKVTPNTAVIDNNDEWVWYTGQNSHIYTFKYPKNFVISEYAGMDTTQVYKDARSKSQNGDHLTFSLYPHDAKNPFDIIAKCESFGKSMGSSDDNSIGQSYQFRYAKVITLGDLQACDYGSSLIQVDNPAKGRMYEFNISFVANQNNYGLIGYALVEKDLDIFHQIATTFKLK